MPAKLRPSQPAAANPRQDEEICLIGATRLQEFIDFARQRGISAASQDKGEMAQAWRQAAAVYKQLEAEEAGAGDMSAVRPLPASIQAHVDWLVEQPHFQTTFSSVPVAFGMVELDRLVVCQQHLTASSIQGMLEAYRRKPSGKALARICLPGEEPPMGFEVVQQHGDEFVFRSDNHDARFLGARVVTGDAIPPLKLAGHAQAVVCLAVGFSSNVLNVVRFGKRMVLNNGYHRAYALRAMGVTHVPCVIQVCANWDDVGLAAAGEMYYNSHPYFDQPRPPLLKDFFDPRLTLRIATHRAERHIRVTYEAVKNLWARP